MSIPAGVSASTLRIRAVDEGGQPGWARRVVVPQSGMEFHFAELLPRVRFIVTNLLETNSRAVVRFYNKRGTAEVPRRRSKKASRR